MNQKKVNKIPFQFQRLIAGRHLLLIFIGVIGAACFDSGGDVENRDQAIPSITLESCDEECTKADVLPFFDHPDLENRLVKARQISGIIEELGRERANFLQTGDFLDLFPTVYYYTTKFEFERLLANKTRHPLEKMDMVIGFFDAYKFNRNLYDKNGTGSVESHWKKYYEKAEMANKTKVFDDKYETMTEILFDGIDAHLVYDLPRYVRHFSLTNRKPLSEMKAEYDALDDVLSAAAAETNRDILMTLKIRRGDQMSKRMFLAGASYMKNSRKMSWDLGVSKRPLLTKDPQPVLPPSASSVRFLPREVAEKGICRKVETVMMCPLTGYRRFKYRTGN